MRHTVHECRTRSGGALSGEGLADRPFAVLWVDDHPENNAVLMEQLQRNGVRVDVARSTREALALLAGRRYRVVVSDMGRLEEGKQVSDAGLRLLSAVRETDSDLPFVIYTSPDAVRYYGEEAIASGRSNCCERRQRAGSRSDPAPVAVVSV